MALLTDLKVRFLSGHERTIRAKKNILALLILKGYNVAISLALIPLTLKLLDDYQYGVWITLFNVLSWISIFDIGIGNGLRNKFSEALAIDNIKEARAYVSTGYFLMMGISFFLIVFFLVPWMIIDWTKVFNVPEYFGKDLFYLIGIAFFLTSIQFTIKLIGTLLTASHKPAVSELIGTVSNTLIFSILFFFKPLMINSLFAVGFVYTAIPLLVFIIASIYFFNNQFKEVSPSIRFFEKKKVESLFSLSSQFFIVQIAVVVIFSTDSMIITHTLSPQEVTSYNIVFRYFAIVTMLAGIFMAPFWSAYTEAAAKNDFSWIKSILTSQLKSMFLVLALVIILFFSARTLIPLWLKNKIELSESLLLGMAIYAIIAVWNNIFAFLLNGLSKPVLSSIISTFAAIINIPVSIFFVKHFDLGNSGVIWGTVICLSPGVIFGPIQTFKILTQNAIGIWNR